MSGGLGTFLVKGLLIVTTEEVTGSWGAYSKFHSQSFKPSVVETIKCFAIFITAIELYHPNSNVYEIG